MIKTIKKIILSSLSILGISFLIWTLFLLNPNLSYANMTEFNEVKVFHNQDLEEQAEAVITEAINIIKQSDLFEDEISIYLCMNDDKVYPNLHLLIGAPMAYAIFNKTTIKNCKVKFDENVAEIQWEVNNNEIRNFNLTWLLAHEFTHNLQYHANAKYVIKTTLGIRNWKLEGHAEYIARRFKNDGKLLDKIEKYLIEETKDHVGIPVFEIEDGTKQTLSYFKYALVIQYLMEEKKLNYFQICDLETDFDKLFKEVIDWSKK